LSDFILWHFLSLNWRNSSSLLAFETSQVEIKPTYEVLMESVQGKLRQSKRNMFWLMIAFFIINFLLN